MVASLDDARAKLDWAKLHLSRLTDEYLDVFNATRIGDDVDFREQEWVTKDERDEDGHRWMVFGRRVPALPDHWGLVLGDAVHSTRSALDVLACQLVQLNGQSPERTQFPIYHLRPNERGRKRIRENLKGMRPAHAEGIERLQPYRNADTRESWLLKTLGALDNLDKHRLVHAVYSVDTREGLDGLRNKLHLTPPVDCQLKLPGASAPVEDGVIELVRVRPAGRTRVEIDWYSAVSVMFGLPSVTLADLLDIHAYVVGIVESFAPDFP